MNKLFITLIFIPLPFLVYAEYDEDILNARKLSQSKKYQEAEIIYKELLKNYNTEELIIDYSNMLAWSSRLKEALKLLEPLNSNSAKELKAKFSLWDKNYKRAFEIYTELLKTNYPLDENALKFMEWYKNYKKFKLGISFDTLLKDEPKFTTLGNSILYDYYGKIKFSFTREYLYKSEKYLRGTNILEIYKGPFYIFLSNSEILKYSLGIDISLWLFTFGAKYSKYIENEVYFYKIEISNYLKDFIITNKANFVYENENISKNYSSGLTYNLSENLQIKYTHYYDFKNLNKGILGISQKFELIDYSLGFSRDFNEQNYGINSNIGVSF